MREEKRETSIDVMLLEPRVKNKSKKRIMRKKKKIIKVFELGESIWRKKQKRITLKI